MKIFNKGKMIIQYSKGIISPLGVVELEKSEADKLKKLYPSDIIDLSDKEISADEIKDKEIEALKAENKKLKEEIEALKSKKKKTKV